MLWAELASVTEAMVAGLPLPGPPLWGGQWGREGVPEVTPRSQGIGGNLMRATWEVQLRSLGLEARS